MNKSNISNLFLNLFIYFFAALFFSYYLNISMLDDGLRHISFAQNHDIMKNWGEVFPHSLFSSYDPWYLWHKFLSFLLMFIKYENIQIVVNTISLFFLMLLVDKHFRANINYDFKSITYILVFSIIYFSYFRYVMVRPDLLSGLFVIFMLSIKNRFFLSFIFTILYGPFYYLFFIYTGSLGLTYIVKKEWKSFFGTFLGSIIVLTIFLATDLNGYIDTVINILTDQSLRMGLEVGEGKPFIGLFKGLSYYVILPLFFIFTLVLIVWKNKYFSKNSIATFLLITSILWINQIRYFSLFLPLFLLYFSEIFFNLNKKRLFYNLRKYYTLIKRYVGASKRATIFFVIAVPYSIFIFSYAFSNKTKEKQLIEGSFFKEERFSNKTILFNKLSLDIYKALYFNPTIKTIPSCSVGWFDDKNLKMKKLYIKMQKDSGITEKELRELIDYVGADIYVHYLRNSEEVLSFEKLKKFGIIPEQIFKNRIIFKIVKSIPNG